LRKIKFYTPALFLLSSAFSCNNNDSFNEYNKNKKLVVTIKIADNIKIEKIKLTSSGGTDSLLFKEIENKEELILKTPQTGEGIFSICIYTFNDTICSPESYIEGGYRPKLKLINNKLEILELL
jgi:hypothetical protein